MNDIMHLSMIFTEMMDNLRFIKLSIYLVKKRKNK